jgi:hypothetical protein
MIIFRGFIFIFSVLDIHKMKFGSIIGRALGSIAGNIIPIKGLDGGAIGETLGGLTGYKTGGKVKKTGPALLHSQEFVLPANAKPTKAQRAIVAKNKRDAKKKR